jgi:4-amino-4-deoxy-L-arabinose transferase-like glycosyltransferase
LFNPGKFPTLTPVVRNVPPSRPRLPAICAILALLALHAILALSSTQQRGVTVDEIFHVTGGYFFNQFADYRIHPENGVLPQRLHGLPAWLAGAQPPPLADNVHWRTSDLHVVSHQFFFESGHDHWPLLLRARALNLLFSLGVCLLVFFWALRLAGPIAGFVALALAAFSPTLLAHGPLATTDAAAALLLSASAGAFWQHLRHGGGRRLALSAAVFGIACVSKFSAVLLLPVFGVLLLVHLAATPGPQRRLGALAASLALHGAAAIFTIWACYGFRHSAFAPGVPAADHLIVTWDWIATHAGWQGDIVGWINRHHLLPEPFLFGYLHTYVSSLSRASFLAGEYSTTGWTSFFPLAFFWKSTPVEIAAVGLALAAAALRARALGPWLLRLAPLLALGLVYGGAAVTSHLNIGHRHLLPLYPAVFILAGVAVGTLRANPRIRLGLATAGVGLQIGAAVAIHPFHLAYFNFFAGGPANGHRLLVDSSLDWGQDVTRIKPWLDAHNSGPAPAPVFLFYFGSASPSYYGIQARRMPLADGLKAVVPFVALTEGIYFVSATNLANVYSPFHGAWTPQWENEYQRLRALEPDFVAFPRDAARRDALLQQASAEEWRHRWTRYDQLRFARLSHYLRIRGADANLGYSIFVYRLSAAEVAAATAGSLEEWRRLIERAAGNKS